MRAATYAATGVNSDMAPNAKRSFVRIFMSAFRRSLTSPLDFRVTGDFTPDFIPGSLPNAVIVGF